MKISIKRATPTVLFNDLLIGQMFLLNDQLYVKVHYTLSSATQPVRNSTVVGGNMGIDIAGTTPVFAVTSVHAEVQYAD